MDEDETHTQQLPSDPRKALVLATNENMVDEVADSSSTPDSARDVARRLIRHALYTVLLATQLFTLPFRLFLRRFVPVLYQYFQGSPVVCNVMKRRNTLHTRLLQWPPLISIFSAWSQVVAMPSRLDRLTTLLEENIELMSMTRGYERDKASNAPAEVCFPDDESAISPVTASAIYHAALANNRTLDNLLDTFDGGVTCTVSCTSNDEREGIPSYRAIKNWAETTSTPQSRKPLNSQSFSGLNVSPSTLDAQQMHDRRSLSHKPSSLQQIPASSLRHRSPAPSMSTTTPQSSPSSSSSIALTSAARPLVANVPSQDERVLEMQPRCTACNKGHSDTEQGSVSREGTTLFQPVPPHRTIRMSRRSAIPRRNGRLLLDHRARTPL